MYGGQNLNRIMNALHTDLDISYDGVYPNGTPNDESEYTEKIEEMQTIADNPNKYIKAFKQKALDAIDTGNYVGFGEFGPLHYSMREGHPDMDFQVDNNEMKWLSDQAAANNMILDIHVEPEEEEIEELKNLLAHNSSTIIVWDHIGWYNYELDNYLDVVSNMLDTYSNLYLNIKLRGSGADEPGGMSPLDSEFNLDESWEAFLIEDADRLMLGTDSKYWQDEDESIESIMNTELELLKVLMDQLPEDTAKQIYYITAEDVFEIEVNR